MNAELSRTSRIPGGLALLVAFALAGAADAQERVGEVVLAAGQVTSTLRAAAAAPLAPGDDVFLDARIETGRRSAAQMTLDPRGVAQLGERARLLLDRATVDEITGRKESFLSLLVGRLRLALSPGAEADVTVDTPTATIGVKGTDVRFSVDRNGATVVAVWEGEVTVTAKAGGPPLVLRAPRATVVAPGRRPTPPAFIRPEGSLGSPSAGGADFTAPWEELTDPLIPPLENVFPFPREPGQDDPAFFGAVGGAGPS